MERETNRQEVQGEESNTTTLLFLFLLGGVAAGSLFINITHPFRGGETDILQFYILDQLKRPIDISRETILRLLILRSRVYLFFILSGLTPASRAIFRWGCAVIGFLMGAAVSMSLLCYSMRGMVMILAATFPHGLFYAGSLGALLTGMYENTKNPWCYFFCFLTWIMGIGAEIWLQPPFFSWIFSVL